MKQAPLNEGRRSALHAVARAAGTLFLALPLAALAQTPAATPAPAAAAASDKAVRLIVGAPAGGTADILARVVGEALSRNLGQPVVVDNRPGGLGAIAMDAFLGAPRDGLTYLVSVNGLVTELPYTLKPKYDPFRDIKPLVEIAGSGLVLVGNPALPPKTLAEMTAWVKANPGKVSFASYTPGTLSHVMGLNLNKLAALDMQHVGYKGSPPALQDVMGGQVQFMFDGLATSVPNIKAGKLRAFAVTSPQRSPVLPDVPTVAELGYPAMTQTAWIGLWSTPDANAAMTARVREQALKALATPEIRQRFGAVGLEVPQQPRTPEQLAASLQKDSATVGELLKSVNYKPE